MNSAYFHKKFLESAYDNQCCEVDKKGQASLSSNVCSHYDPKDHEFIDDGLYEAEKVEENDLIVI